MHACIYGDGKTKPEGMMNDEYRIFNVEVFNSTLDIDYWIFIIPSGRVAGGVDDAEHASCYEFFVDGFFVAVGIAFS